MVQREIIITGDGSPSIWVPNIGESYHSRFGARQESRHVFIEAGLLALPLISEPIRILEIGFGTGLNALLTQLELEQLHKNGFYETLEPYPVVDDEAILLCKNLNEIELDVFRKLHTARWGVVTNISDHFQLLKHQTLLADFIPTSSYHLIYFDAFSPEVQPELWTVAVFKKLFESMETDGILTTYCSKGLVRRNMQEAGFSIEKIPGPPGKREITRASKKC